MLGWILKSVPWSIMGSSIFKFVSNIFSNSIEGGHRSIDFAYLLSSTGMAMIFPWARTDAVAAFGTGKIKINDMIKS